MINFHGGGAGAFFAQRRQLLARTIRRSSELVVPSGFLRDVFAGFGIGARIIPNIANLERFAYRLREPAPPIVLSVRNLTPVYNVACALRAFARIRSEYPEAVLYVAGDGPERRRLENLRVELELDKVEFLGNLDNAELAGYYERANLFINTSTTDNMPVSILEAFASGLPVVSTEVGGIPYLVRHGETGLLAADNDHRSLGDSLLRLIREPELARTLTEQARREVQRYSCERVRAEWIGVYSRLHAGQETASPED